MKTKQQLLNELEGLKKALNNGYITSNEYQSLYFNIYQQLKKLK